MRTDHLMMNGWKLQALIVLIGLGLMVLENAKAQAEVRRTAQSGPWTEASTWELGKQPQSGDQVLIRAGHRVIYDRDSSEPIRVVHIAGVLSFASDRDTRLDVGLIRITSDEVLCEEGFDCTLEHNESSTKPASGLLPALEVGTPAHPIPAKYSARIRLVYFEGMNKESLPAIVCCQGRMDIHGSPLKRTWVRLGESAAVGESRLFLDERVDDWKPGDRVVITATSRQRPFAGHSTRHVTDSPASEVRFIEKLDQSEESRVRLGGSTILRLTEPLQHPHRAEPGYAGEVANLSRNVVIESADPQGVRGHTMYHRHASGAISYAEFRHLGKENVLGRYPIHFHLAGDTMRGSYVLGASVWDSHNRWITVHGTQYLVIRDCVGYRSLGHGFFLEDGTEVFNTFDRNLAIQALVGQKLPKQVLPFDENDGAGFWWANSLNAFTRNVAVECDQHAFRFEAAKTADFDPELPIPQPDGSVKKIDIRTLPFIRFDDNEAHAQRRFALNLGGIRGMTYGGGEDQPQSVSGDVQGIGPDPSHPFIIRNFKVWDAHWAFHGGSPCVLVDGLDIYDCQYGIWRSIVSWHQYRNLSLREIRSHAIFFPMDGIGPGIGLKDGKPSFPQSAPVDDLPPATMITHLELAGPNRLLVRGTAIDNDVITAVFVNDMEAEPVRPNFAEWKVVLPMPTEGRVTAFARDRVGQVEPRPHVRALSPQFSMPHGTAGTHRAPH